LQGSKLLALKISLYQWKGLEVEMSKMTSHEPFGHLKNKLWAKERPGVKTANLRENDSRPLKLEN
jgi:hypothetical protein